MPESSLLKKHQSTRHTYWSQFGDVEQNLIEHLVEGNGQKRLDTGELVAPRWPARLERYITVRTSESVIIATDGLSDPKNDHVKEQGLGIEFYVELPTEAFEKNKTWAERLLHGVVQSELYTKSAYITIKTYGFIGIEIPRFPLPDELEVYINDRGKIHTLVNILHPKRPNTLDMPLEKIHIANINLLTKTRSKSFAEGTERRRSDMFEKLSNKQDPTFLA